MPTFNYKKFTLSQTTEIQPINQPEMSLQDIVGYINVKEQEIFDYMRTHVNDADPEIPYAWAELLASIRDFRKIQPKSLAESAFVDTRLNAIYHEILDWLQQHKAQQGALIKKQKAQLFTPQEEEAALFALQIFQDPFLIAKKAYEYILERYNSHYNEQSDPFRMQNPEEREELQGLFGLKLNGESAIKAVLNSNYSPRLKRDIFVITRNKTELKLVKVIKDLWDEYKDVLTPQQFSWVVHSSNKKQPIPFNNFQISKETALAIRYRIANAIWNFNTTHALGKLMSGTDTSINLPFLLPEDIRPITLDDIMEKAGFSENLRALRPSWDIRQSGAEAEKAVKEMYVNTEMSPSEVTALSAHAKAKAERDKAIQLLTFAINAGGYEDNFARNGGRGGNSLGVVLGQSKSQALRGGEKLDDDVLYETMSDYAIKNIFDNYCGASKTAFISLLIDAGFEHLKDDVGKSDNIPDRFYGTSPGSPCAGFALNFQSQEEGALIDKLRTDFGLLAIPYRLGLPAPPNCLTNQELVVDFVITANIIQRWSIISETLTSRFFGDNNSGMLHPYIAPNVVFVGEYFGFNSDIKKHLDKDYTVPGTSDVMSCRSDDTKTMKAGETVTLGDIYNYKTQWKQIVETFYAHMLGGKALFLDSTKDEAIIAQLDPNNILYKHKTCAISDTNIHSCVPTKTLFYHLDQCSDPEHCSGCQFLKFAGYVPTFDTLSDTTQFVSFFDNNEPNTKNLVNNYIDAAIAHLKISEAGKKAVDDASRFGDSDLTSDAAIAGYYKEYEQLRELAKKLYRQYLTSKDEQSLHNYYTIMQQANDVFNNKFKKLISYYQGYLDSGDFKNKIKILNEIKELSQNATYINTEDIRKACQYLIHYDVKFAATKINELATLYRIPTVKSINISNEKFAIKKGHWYKSYLKD